MTKAKVVLIDDHEEMRENIKEILELDNYQVFDAADGKSGIKLIRNTQPDLIICDIMMPELDGYGVLKIINQDKELAGTPFIFLTAKNDLKDFRNGMNMGADDYLTKPFTDLQLIEAIDMRLKRVQHFKNKQTEQNEALSNLQDPIQWHKNRFTKNEVIFRNGSFADRVYLVNQGQVKLAKQNHLGKVLITDIIQEGHFFGHIDVIAEKPYSNTATAFTDAELTYLNRTDFQLYLLKDKLFCKRISKELAIQINDTEEQLLSMAFSSVRKRMIDALLHLNKQWNTKGEIPFTLQIKRNELAAITGTVKETAIRCLKDLEDEELIFLLPRGIKILNQMGLESLSQQKVI